MRAARFRFGRLNSFELYRNPTANRVLHAGLRPF